MLYEGGVCDRDIFCTGTTPAQTVNKLVAYAQKTWGKNAYIVAADYNYGQITAKWMTKYTQDGGGKVFATEFFPLDVSNFSARHQQDPGSQAGYRALGAGRLQPHRLLPPVGGRRA